MGKDAACRDECPATLKPPIANRLNRVNEYGSAVCHDTSSVTGHSASRSVADDLAVPLKEIWLRESAAVPGVVDNLTCHLAAVLIAERDNASTPTGVAPTWLVTLTVDRTMATEEARSLAHVAPQEHASANLCWFPESWLHYLPTVAMDTLKRSPIDEILRQFDDLVAEARRLRERIVAALRHEREPFFPERRYHYEPHEPDRRNTRKPEEPRC
jgi:hypothetical protein